MTMKVGSTDNCRGADIMELIDGAPWREAVTYRETWPHEYVVINQDGQQELLECTTRSALVASTFSWRWSTVCHGSAPGHYYPADRPQLRRSDAGLGFWCTATSSRRTYCSHGVTAASGPRSRTSAQLPGSPTPRRASGPHGTVLCTFSERCLEETRAGGGHAVPAQRAQEHREPCAISNSTRPTW